MEESELRGIVCEILEKRYKKEGYKFHLSFLIFHNLGLTLTDYLKRKFKGESLINIPKYNKLFIKPDVVGIVIHPETEKYLWVISECKSGIVSQADFRQAIDYCNQVNAFHGYLHFDGELSSYVKRNIEERRAHLYSGMNKWGENVTIEMKIYKYIAASNTFKQQY